LQIYIIPHEIVTSAPFSLLVKVSCSNIELTGSYTATFKTLHVHIVPIKSPVNEYCIVTSLILFCIINEARLFRSVYWATNIELSKVYGTARIKPSIHISQLNEVNNLFQQADSALNLWRFNICYRACEERTCLRQFCGDILRLVPDVDMKCVTSHLSGLGSLLMLWHLFCIMWFMIIHQSSIIINHPDYQFHINWVCTA